MTKKEALEKLPKFSEKVLTMLEKDGHISFPLSEGEFKSLLFLHDAVWRKPVYLALQLAKYSVKERVRIINTCNLDKIESYIFTRIQNIQTRGKKRILTAQIISEVMYYFKLPKTEQMHTKLKKTVLRMRKLIKRQQKPLNMVATPKS